MIRDSEPNGPRFGPTPRARFIAELAEQVKALALAGDVAAARVACEALARTLGIDGGAGQVLDLADARRDRERGT